MFASDCAFFIASARPTQTGLSQMRFKSEFRRTYSLVHNPPREESGLRATVCGSGSMSVALTARGVSEWQIYREGRLATCCAFHFPRIPSKSDLPQLDTTFRFALTTIIAMRMLFNKAESPPGHAPWTGVEYSNQVSCL